MSSEANENIDTKNIILFPITKYIYKRGITRWKEPYNPDENIGYCGPPDDCCIDCYLCFSPICAVLDTVSLCLFQCLKIN